MPRAKPKKRIPTEANITEQVIDACRILGIALERQNTGGAYYGERYVSFGEEGDSDFRATLPGGRRFALEIKRPGERPTEAQLHKLREINRMGGVGIWTDDPAKFLRLMPRVLNEGGWVEIDDDGEPFICHDPN